MLLGLIAAAFALIGTTMPLMLHAQAAWNRAYYEQFRAAAAYIERPLTTETRTVPEYHPNRDTVPVAG